MRAKGGQVALYLVMTLVAIAFLMFMNVGTFLAVSARNKTMNAGDAAALAVAKHQGELLNRIGQLNLEHLKLAFKGDPAATARCAEIVEEQSRLCFLGPLEGLTCGNEAARANEIEVDDEMTEILRQHVNDVRSIYMLNPETYPPPWENAWQDYAQRLETAIAGGVLAGPDNVDFVDAAGGHMLLNRQFYDAIAGRNWCWFHFNASGLINGYSSFRDWGPLPVADEETRRERCLNSEVYSLHLDRRLGRAIDIFGLPILMKLLNCSEKEILDAPLLSDQNQVWFCYGGQWRIWWEIDPDGEWQFPVVGRVKPQYDVRGCAAICRVTRKIPNLVDRAGERVSTWAAAAKPFGTVEGLEGKDEVVTAYDRFVTPAFSDVRLVPLDTVGGKDLATADAAWMLHVRKHLPAYFQNGPTPRSVCYYCQQLWQWEQRIFRESGQRWIKVNSAKCIRAAGSGGHSHGGSAHGH